jgi:hypothetical protein
MTFRIGLCGGPAAVVLVVPPHFETEYTRLKTHPFTDRCPRSPAYLSHVFFAITARRPCMSAGLIAATPFTGDLYRELAADLQLRPAINSVVDRPDLPTLILQTQLNQ